MDYFRTLDESKARLDQFRREADAFRVARNERRRRRHVRRGFPDAR